MAHTDPSKLRETSLLSLQILKTVDTRVSLYQNDDFAVMLIVSFGIHCRGKIKVISCDESIVGINAHDVRLSFANFVQTCDGTVGWIALITFNDGI